MILKNASLMATGGVLAVGALMFAGPAAAHSGGAHAGAQAGGAIHEVVPSGPAGESVSKVSAELPMAPIGTAGSKIGMELALAHIGTAGSGAYR